MSRQYGVGATLGTTTIEYDEGGISSALGFFPGGGQSTLEDLEAH